MGPLAAATKDQREGTQTNQRENDGRRFRNYCQIKSVDVGGIRGVKGEDDRIDSVGDQSGTERANGSRAGPGRRGGSGLSCSVDGHFQSFDEGGRKPADVVVTREIVLAGPQQQGKNEVTVAGAQPVRQQVVTSEGSARQGCREVRAGLLKADFERSEREGDGPARKGGTIIGVLLLNALSAKSIGQGTIVHRLQVNDLGLGGSYRGRAKQCSNKTFHEAILGVDNSPIICRMGPIPLSSVRTNDVRIGYEAARLLAANLASDLPVAEPILIPPLRVVERTSTSVFAVEDRRLAEVLRWIRLNAAKGTNVEDVVRHFKMDRRNLEKKMRTALGPSPLEEIRRQKILLAKRFLTETDWPMPLVAERSGFSEAKAFGNAFSKYEAQSPSHYRKRFCGPVRPSG